MTIRCPATGRFFVFLFLLVACAMPGTGLRAQLLPKGIGVGKPIPPQRPEGRWQGQAHEAGSDGKPLEYPVEFAFSGSDDALQLAVTATAKVEAEGGLVLTVAIRARYAGTFAAGRLAMHSESIEVKIQETGETVPQNPQQVEARLENGELKGRVGSAGDGWTEFAVKPIAATAAAKYTGRWSGTCREAGPDGRELTYPIRVAFSGGADDLHAEVAADLEYPLEDGSTTPIEYRATFRGQVQNGELDLRSEQVRIRVVQQDRTEDAPAQLLRGHIADGVLLAQIGGQGGEASQLELRPEGAADGTVETVHTPAASAYPTLVLQRLEIADPGLGGVVSHTLSVPTGWRFTGAPRWTGNPDHIVDFVGELRGPAAESLQFVGDRQFRYSHTQSQLGPTDDADGRTDADGTTHRDAPKQPGEVAAAVIVPQLHPDATDIRVVAAERMPKLEEALRALLKPQLDMMDAMCRQSRMASANGIECRADTWLAVERSRVRYRERGEEWEEEIQCSLQGMYSSLASSQMRTDSGFWILSQVRTARAHAGSLDDRLSVLWLCAGTLAETPRWSAAVDGIRLEIAKAKTQSMRAGLDEIIRRGAAAAQARAEISDMQMQSWRTQQDSLERVHKARIDALGERHDFRSADGNLHTVTNHYDRAFKDHRGYVILTNDPNYRPAADAAVNNVTWEEMQRIDPFREGR